MILLLWLLLGCCWGCFGSNIAQIDDDAIRQINTSTHQEQTVNGPEEARNPEAFLDANPEIRLLDDLFQNFIDRREEIQNLIQNQLNGINNNNCRELQITKRNS